MKEFYQQNRLIKGELGWAAGRSSLAQHRLPGARRGREGGQYRAARLREGAHGRGVEPDKEYLELPGGHISLIAGRGASTHCWPKVAAWLAARS